MGSVIQYTQCPVCNCTNTRVVLIAKDYTVSQANFVIAECIQCTLRFTQDVPDEMSIAPFYKVESYISHTNTSRGVINKLYKYVRKKTLVQKRKLIERLTQKSEGNLLDVGAGTGGFLNEMKRGNWQVTGLEPNGDAKAVAKSLYNLDLLESQNLFELPSHHFDVITMWHVLEHVHELHKYMNQLKKILTTNGRLIIAVPNYTSFDAVAYQQHWAAYDVPRHLYHFSPKSMQSLVEKHELKLIEIKPMWFDSFYVSLLSSKYKNQKTNWIGGGWTGLISNIKAIQDKKKCSSLIYVIAK